MYQNKEGRREGFGSWFGRRYGNYSLEEHSAAQGHKDRVRTADLIGNDRFERNQDSDDSKKPSDWEWRTGVRPPNYRKYPKTGYPSSESKTRKNDRRR